MEVLAPVKDLKAAKAVIAAGADAIYFASPSFGARVLASIELEEVMSIIKLAKMANVKTYATFNTVIFNQELEQFFQEIDNLYCAGVDGIIIQDFSFISILAHHYPELEIHVSTQMHVHNSDGGKLVKNLGANRIVVPREMSLSRIADFKNNVDIDIEAFVHGALCVSYSGQCYDSTLLDQKSANRGRCSQYCRMPQYTVFGPTGKTVSNGEYPLNLRDINNLENVENYRQAGINSLKIEGRLKSIDYAYLTTKAYRQAVDGGVAIDLTDVYNREFTTGRITGVNGRELVNLYRPNNNGKLVGKIANIEANTARSLKYYTNVITIDLEPTVVLEKSDNLRFVGEDYEDGQGVEQFKELSPGRILLFSNCQPETGDEVYRTSNSQILHAAEQADIDCRIVLNVNLFFKGNELYFTVNHQPPINSGIIFEKAKSRPVTKADIIEKLNKTKNTDFIIEIGDFKYNDNQFCQLSKIKDLKHQILSTGQELVGEANIANPYIPNLPTSPAAEGVNLYIEVNTREQFNYVRNLNIDCQLLISYNLHLQSPELNGNEYLVLPSVVYDDELSQIDLAVKSYQKLVVSDLGMLNRYPDKELLSNFTLNTTNSINQRALIDSGVEKCILSIELNKDKLQDFGSEYSILNIYGRIPVMIMDYCPINMKKGDSCGSCNKCREGDYFLTDKLERKFPLAYAGNNRISMLSSKPLSLLGNFDFFAEHGISNFHLRFTNETAHEVESVIDNLLDQKNDLDFPTNTGSFHKQTL